MTTEPSEKTDLAAPRLRPGFLRDPRVWNVACAVFVFGVALYLFSWGIGSYALNDPWEPRYPQTVREMLQRGDLITPYYEGEIRWTKPILIYWAMMPAVKIWGNNEFSARLPGAIFAALGVLSVYFCLFRLRGRGTALMGAGILATTPMYYFLARYCTPDILLASTLGASMMFFALGRFGDRRKTLWYCVSYGCLGLAFLAKGPVACVIAMASVTFFWLLDFEPRRLFSRSVFGDIKRLVLEYRMIQGAITFFLVSGPWYIGIWMQHGYEFIDSFVRAENVHRFSEPVRGLKGSSSHYVETVFFGFWPWASLLPAGLIFLCCGRPAQRDEGTRQVWYFMCWLIAIFLIFTFSGSKLDHYILPLTVPFAVMVALVWEQAFKRPTPFWVRAAFIVSLGFASLPLRDFILLGNRYIMDAFTTKRDITNVDVDSAVMYLHGAWAVAIIGVVMLTRYAKVMGGLAVAATLACGIFFSHVVVPKQAPVRTVKHYVNYYLDHAEPDTALGFFGTKRRHTVSYYTGGKDGYTFFSPKNSNDMVDLAKDKDLWVIIESNYSGVMRKFLARETGGVWHRLKSENPRYDLLVPGSPPAEPPDWK